MERRSLSCLKWGTLCLYVHIYVGAWDLLPDFAGVLLFLASIGSQEWPTQAELRLKPLLWVLAADYFLHWIWQFESGLEGLLIWVISIYTVYVFFGEAARRISQKQPDKARVLDFLRSLGALLQCAAFFSASFGNHTLDILVNLAFVVIWAALAVTLARIRPLETA